MIHTFSASIWGPSTIIVRETQTRWTPKLLPEKCTARHDKQILKTYVAVLVAKDTYDLGRAGLCIWRNWNNLNGCRTKRSLLYVLVAMIHISTFLSTVAIHFNSYCNLFLCDSDNNTIKNIYLIEVFLYHFSQNKFCNGKKVGSERSYNWQVVNILVFQTIFV